MTIKNYYYKQGDNVLRVQADSFTQVVSQDTQAIPGITYLIEVWATCVRFGRPFTSYPTDTYYTGYYRQTWTAPFGNPIYPGVAIGGRSRADRYKPPPLQFEIPEGDYRLDEISTDPVTDHRDNSSQCIGPTVNKVLTPVPGQELPPTEQACTTTFYREGQSIYSLNTCPAISEKPPDDCADCCKLLLPLMRKISL